MVAAPSSALGPALHLYWRNIVPRGSGKFPFVQRQFPTLFSRELEHETADTWGFLAHSTRQNRLKMRFCPVNSRRDTRDRFAGDCLHHHPVTPLPRIRETDDKSLYFAGFSRRAIPGAVSETGIWPISAVCL